MSMGSPHLYRLRGREIGARREIIEAALTSSAIVEARGLTPVLSLGHLAHRTGAPYHYLRSIVERRRDPYQTFEISRRRGSTPRVISSPEATLLQVQKWILRNILSRVEPHSSSYAYQSGKSIRKCAQQHLGAEWLVKLDVHDFFHSVDERQVYRAFFELGYGPLASFEMARICTRRAIGGFPDRGRFSVPYRTRAAIPEYSNSTLGFVPQGAPTSGALANLVARPLDMRLSQIAGESQMVYTRYADDIVLSALYPFDRTKARRVIELARRAIEESHFRLHHKKTHVVPPGARRIVLGLLVDGDRLRLSKDMRARIESHIYGVEKFGLRSHQLTRGFSSLLGLARHIEGLLSFAHDIDPQWAALCRTRWRVSLRRDAPILAPYTLEDVFVERQRLSAARFSVAEADESATAIAAPSDDSQQPYSVVPSVRTPSDPVAPGSGPG
jgi:RNA-directed DNA polymerase